MIDAIETAIGRMAAHPGIGSPRYAALLEIPGLRHWTLPKFPYGLFYLEYEDRVEILRFLHMKRDIADSLAHDPIGLKPFEITAEASIGPVLRRATAADADAIAAVTDAPYAKWVPIIGRKPVPMMVDYAVAVRDHLIDVLESDGTIIALIELVPEPRCLVIENIAVLPAHAGRGHGRRLMAHADRVAADHRLGRVRLYTNRKMTRNISLYQQLGFAIDHEEVKDDGRTIVHMSRSVAAIDR